MKDYIRWRYQDTEIVNAEDITAKVKELDDLGAGAPKTKTVMDDWLEYRYAYHLDTTGKWTVLYFMDRDGDMPTLHKWRSNSYKRKEEYKERVDKKIWPNQCKKEIVRLFKKYNGVSLCTAYKPVKCSEFKNCVPKPTYYIDRDLLCMDIPSVQYIDVSSMFPANARGRLPDAHTAIRIEGYAKPTEEYPFAFYLNSHHCAEYGVFDTHDYLSLKTEYFMWQCHTYKGKKMINIYNRVEDEDEVTVLMKPSQYEMTDVFEEIYERKLKGDKLAKAIANIGIGTLHKNPDNADYTKGRDISDYYHVAAIILGRSNKKQYDMIKKIEDNHGIVLQTIVDSIIYVGEENYGISEKVLGTYYNEFGRTVHYRGAAINKYVIYDDDYKILKYVVSGVDKEDQVVNVPEDIDKYVKEE